MQDYENQISAVEALRMLVEAGQMTEEDIALTIVSSTELASTWGIPASDVTTLVKAGSMPKYLPLGKKERFWFRHQLPDERPLLPKEVRAEANRKMSRQEKRQAKVESQQMTIDATQFQNMSDRLEELERRVGGAE